MTQTNFNSNSFISTEKRQLFEATLKREVNYELFIRCHLIETISNNVTYLTTTLWQISSRVSPW